MSRIYLNTFHTRHKVLFAIGYVGMPVLLAWIGYIVMGTVHNENPLGDAIAMSASTALYELPRVSLTMSTGGFDQKAGMMKLDIGIEVDRRDLKRVTDYEPRILERIFMYMHKQDYNKLQEPDSARWVRQGLEKEISDGAIPVRISSVYVNRMVFE